MLKIVTSAVVLVALTAGSASTALAGGCSSCTSSHISMGTSCPIPEMMSMPAAPATAQTQQIRSYSYDPAPQSSPAYIRPRTTGGSAKPAYLYPKSDPRRFR